MSDEFDMRGIKLTGGQHAALLAFLRSVGIPSATVTPNDLDALSPQADGWTSIATSVTEAGETQQLVIRYPTTEEFRLHSRRNHTSHASSTPTRGDAGVSPASQGRRPASD